MEELLKLLREPIGLEFIEIEEHVFVPIFTRGNAAYNQGIKLEDWQVACFIDFFQSYYDNYKKVTNIIETYNEKVHDEWISQMRGGYYRKEDKKEKIKKSGFVYLLKCNVTNFYKIGCTSMSNPKQRIDQLKNSNPSIETVQCFKTDDILKEKELHKIFESKKVRGEWFSLDNNDLEYISNFNF